MEEILKQILSEIKGMNTDIQDVKTEIKDMKTHIQDMKSQVSENTQMLKSLQHSVEVQKAVQDKMSFDIAEIKGDIKGIRNDLNTVEIVRSKNWNDIAKLKCAK